MRGTRVWTLALTLATIGPLLGLGSLAGAALAPAAQPASLAFETHSHKSISSTNWAGYAVTSGSGGVTEVKGSWIQPRVTCTSSTAYAAFWDGIDGYSSSTVEQAGTLAECSGGKAQYSAWYEFYPKPSKVITTLTVKPGDAVSVTVSYAASTSDFTVVVKIGKSSFTKVAMVSGAERSSAECITELPSVGSSPTLLADFGVANFGKEYTSKIGCSATVGGTTGSFGSFSSVVSINLKNSALKKALCRTGTLSKDGTSFTVTWIRAS
jgi:hypothetical protein